MKKCSNCEKPVVAKGYCQNHYMQNIHNQNRPLYSVWNDMKQRCYNKNHAAYKYYGGRGITVCDQWLNSYDSFVADMGDKPGPLYSLDRIDNDGNYEPGNCRWATKREQVANRRVEARPRANNKSGELGIRKLGNRWHLRGRYGKHIGTYATREEAIVARNNTTRNY